MTAADGDVGDHHGELGGGGRVRRHAGGADAGVATADSDDMTLCHCRLLMLEGGWRCAAAPPEWVMCVKSVAGQAIGATDRFGEMPTVVSSGPRSRAIAGILYSGVVRE